MHYIKIIFSSLFIFTLAILANTHSYAANSSQNNADEDKNNSGLHFNLNLNNLISLAKNFTKDEVIENYEPGELLIIFDNEQQKDIAFKILQEKYNLKPNTTLALTELDNIFVAQFILPTIEKAQQMKQILNKQYPLWIVDLNSKLFEQTKTEYSNNARIYTGKQLNINLNQALNLEIKIGVMDANLDESIPLNVNYKNIKNFVSNYDNQYNNQHGNDIAKLLAGKIENNGFSGIARGVNLYWATIVKNINASTSNSNTLLAISALNWLLQQKVDIINISLGGKGDAILAEIFSKLQQKSTLIIASGGNSGSQSSPVYPAGYSGVIAVTAIDAKHRVYSNANQGPYIRLAAPGVDIWLPEHNSNRGNYVTGTSYASILAAGAISRLGNEFWQLNKIKKHRWLCNNAIDLGENGWDEIYGCGLINIQH